MRSFDAFMRDLEEMAARLSSSGAEKVAVEAMFGAIQSLLRSHDCSLYAVHLDRGEQEEVSGLQIRNSGMNPCLRTLGGSRSGANSRGVEEEVTACRGVFRTCLDCPSKADLTPLRRNLQIDYKDFAMHANIDRTRASSGSASRHPAGSLHARCNGTCNNSETAMPATMMTDMRARRMLAPACTATGRSPASGRT